MCGGARSPSPHCNLLLMPSGQSLRVAAIRGSGAESRSLRRVLFRCLRSARCASAPLARPCEAARGRARPPRCEEGPATHLLAKSHGRTCAMGDPFFVFRRLSVVRHFGGGGNTFRPQGPKGVRPISPQFCLGAGSLRVDATRLPKPFELGHAESFDIGQAYASSDRVSVKSAAGPTKLARLVATFGRNRPPLSPPARAWSKFGLSIVSPPASTRLGETWTKFGPMLATWPGVAHIRCRLEVVSARAGG